MIVKEWEGLVDEARGYRRVEGFDEVRGTKVSWAEAVQDVQSFAVLNTDKICSAIQREAHTDIVYQVGNRPRVLRTPMSAEQFCGKYLWMQGERRP